MLNLKAEDYESFVEHMDELMTIQDRLENMGKGVESDILIMMITNEIPKAYNQIVTMLTRKIDEEAHVEIEEWLDIVEAHVNMVDSKEGVGKTKGEKKHAIAHKAGVNGDGCFHCGSLDHMKKQCPKWKAKKEHYARMEEKKAARCGYCDKGGHCVKECPLIVPTDAKCGCCGEGGHEAKQCGPKINHEASTIKANKASTSNLDNDKEDKEHDAQDEEESSDYSEDEDLARKGTIKFTK